MSQQLLLDISNATARSKGQARRRNQPAQSEDARKAQRNLARRERARCRKMGPTDQKLPYSAASFPFTSPHQSGQLSTFKSKQKAASENSEITRLPPLLTPTVIRAYVNYLNVGPLANWNSPTTPSNTQESGTSTQDDVPEADHVSVIHAGDGLDSRIASEEQDRNAADILVGVAKEQHLPTPTLETRTISVRASGIPDSGARVEYSLRCPVINCGFNETAFPSKAERDKHTITHYDGIFGLIRHDQFVFVDWPRFSEASKSYFDKTEAVKHNIKLWGMWNWDKVECSICKGEFDLIVFVEHLDDCIVREVELNPCCPSAIPPKCPYPYCGRDTLSRFELDQHMRSHHRWPGAMISTTPLSVSVECLGSPG